MCGNPVCRRVLTLELHHIAWVKDGGGNEPSNLLPLCANCHSLHTMGHIPIAAIRHWKGMLIALSNAFDREGMDLLLYVAATDTGGGMWYTADGVARFARLIAAGLLKFDTMPTSDWPAGTRHILRLTERGQQLLDAWRSGDEDKYRQLLEAGA